MIDNASQPSSDIIDEIVAFAVVGTVHPALPGHFPGKTIVPGVLLLNEVWRAVRNAFGSDIGLAAILAVKFHAEVAPDDRLRIGLSRTGDAIRFTVQRARRESNDCVDDCAGARSCRKGITVLSGKLQCSQRHA